MDKALKKHIKKHLIAVSILFTLFLGISFIETPGLYFFSIFQSALEFIGFFIIIYSIILLLNIILLAIQNNRKKALLISTAIFYFLFCLLILAQTIYIFFLVYDYDSFPVAAILVVIESLISLALIYASFLGGIKLLGESQKHQSSRRLQIKRTRRAKEASSQLRTLKKLLDDGIISQEVFDEKKKKYTELL